MDKNKAMDLEKVSVKSKAQLDAALAPFIEGKAQISKLLIEGMDMVKRQAKFAEAPDGDIDEYGGFFPAAPPDGQHYMWVDTLIMRRLDGKRNGLTIEWELPEGKFQYNPWTKALSNA